MIIRLIPRKIGCTLIRSSVATTPPLLYRYSSTNWRNKQILNKFKKKLIPHSLVDNDYIYRQEGEQAQEDSIARERDQLNSNHTVDPNSQDTTEPNSHNTTEHITHHKTIHHSHTTNPYNYEISIDPNKSYQEDLTKSQPHLSSNLYDPTVSASSPLPPPPPPPPSPNSYDPTASLTPPETPSQISNLKPIPPNDLYVSCTIFDHDGNITSVSKKYPKMKFLRDNHLFPRDFRKIDTSSIDVAPSIMVRSPNAILINLLHIKAIIKKDCVMVFDTSTPEIVKKLGLFMYDLEMKLKMPSGNLCYEFKALECILISIMSYLEEELKFHLSSCGLILSELEDQVDRNKLQDLLIKLKKLSSFYQKTLLIKDVLEEVLDNDEDLEGMYLSKNSDWKLKDYENDVMRTSDVNHPQSKSTLSDSAAISKHDAEDKNYEDLEMILESYYNQCDEFVQQSGSLLNDIKVTEEIINIILDTNRNSLMLFELKLTVYTLGFTVATLLPAFYGMNLKNYIEDSNMGFLMVLVFSIVQGLIITFINFRKLHKVQNVTMMGSKSSSRHHLSSPVGTFRKDKWWYRMFWGGRNTTYHHPTMRERDVIWRMINDDKGRK